MKLLLPMLAGFFVSLSLSVATADEHPGKEIHDDNCLKCHKVTHDEAFYTRKDRKTKDFKRLQSMVKMFDARMGTKMFDDEMEDVWNYLNDSYYKFPEK